MPERTQQSATSPDKDRGRPWAVFVRLVRAWPWPLASGAVFTGLAVLTWYRAPSPSAAPPGGHVFLNSPWTIAVALVGGLCTGLAVQLSLRAADSEAPHAEHGTADSGATPASADIACD